MIALQNAPASPCPLPQRARARHLDIDPASFRAGFNQTPFLIGHSLCQHPLFALDRLLELARTLPEECIEYNAGKLPVSISHAETPRNGLSPAETVRRIAECKSWLVMKYVERDPEYKALLDECLAQVAEHSEAICPGMCYGQAFVFLTSPGSVTPLHIDPEHNFLLQIRGSKEVHLYDGRDRQLLPEEQLEHFYSDRGRNMTHQPWFEEKSWTYNIQPGQGLHFPVTYPHWVKNGEEVSISFSITFRTPDLDRRRALYSMNANLRRWKLAPKAVGASPLRDGLLFNAYRVGRKLGMVKR
jgi:hypothetical protein